MRKEPHEHNPFFLQGKTRRVVSEILASIKESTYTAELGLVDRVSANAKWIQHGTGPAGGWNTWVDYCAAEAGQ